LLNALLKEERAIVTPFAGTTRDTIEEEIVLDGILFRFIDTAGLRETSDTIEKIGVDKTFEKLRQSRVIIYLFDVNEMKAEEVEKEISVLGGTKSFVIPAANKIDLAIKGLEKNFNKIKNLVTISAKKNMYLDELKHRLTAPFIEGIKSADETSVSNVRHYDALLKTKSSLEKVSKGIEKKVTNDFIASDLRHALNYLGEITGEITTENLLNNIFERFCIGK